MISVIVAARDASATLPDTLASLQAQSYSDWEAIVVDDGSVDDTGAIVERHAAEDPRVRLVRTSSRNVSAARNAGIAVAHGAWLLFLDADDSLFPDALSAFRRGIDAEPAADVICGGWMRVARDGSVATRERWPITRDMFPVFARLSAFAIHSCVVRRDLVLAAGGFDASYITCEEWDLWQRLARAGARFASIEADVARYHMRAGSASTRARQMLVDGMRVITTGHSRDARVSSPLPRYADGFRESDAAVVRYGYACWPAGLVLGAGGDPTSLLDEVAEGPAPHIDPSLAAEALFRSATLPLAAGPERWKELWPEMSVRVGPFLQALERRTGARLLAQRVLAALARFMLQGAASHPAGMQVGNAVLHVVDVCEAIDHFVAPRGVDRAVVRVQHGADTIGFVELPVCDGRIDGAVLQDAIAHEFGWAILGRFFEQGVYSEIRRRATAGGEQVLRHGVVLAEISNGSEWDTKRHDTIGWTVFLQELWGRRDWPSGYFYDPDRRDRGMEARQAQDGWISVDVLDPPADWKTDRPAVTVELTIAGIAVCCLELAPHDGGVRAARLRALLTTAAGVELVHVAVREGLLGTSWPSQTLGDLLARRRSRRLAVTERRGDDTALSPSSVVRAAELFEGNGALDVIGARRYGPPGSAASRRAVFPSSAGQDVLDAARTAGDLVLTPSHARPATHVLYAPELLSAGAQQALPAPRASAPGGVQFGRHHFEALFASGADPWRYTTPYEAKKYEQTLSLLPAGRIQRALEIGCAEGHFTDVLATRVEALVAADISAIAIERAAARCRERPNVSFARVDVVRDPLPGDNDLIVCSEMLYFVGTVDDLQSVACKLRDALRDGGRLVTAHANVASDDPSDTGYVWDVPFGVRTIKGVLSQTPGLQLARELRTPLYSVLEFERSDRPRTAEVVDVDYTMPAPHIAETIRWKGSDAQPARSTSTATVPILMYHRVADRGSAAASPYRVTPAAFSEQLAYLRDAGFQGISLAEWTTAIHARQGVDHRRVAITFDDAYVDFAESALPLLQQYGFGAALFVVTSHVGGENAWDAAYGETVPLMDWAAICHAADAGIEIGAHSATHPPLTGLSPAGIVTEASRARAELQRRIRRPVTAFAYPYGDSDRIVEHLVGGCGYLTGVTCRAGRSTVQDRPLRLPRIEITGADTLTDFIRKVGN